MLPQACCDPPAPKFFFSLLFFFSYFFLLLLALSLVLFFPIFAPSFLLVFNGAWQRSFLAQEAARSEEMRIRKELEEQLCPKEE